MDNRTLVLYHAHCADGFCAAWMYRKKFPDSEFVPVSYGGPLPDCKGRHVVMLDFSVKREVLAGVAEQAASVLILDHHATAEKELAGPTQSPWLSIHFDMAKSGARLTQEYLEIHSNWLADYTEDRDLWRWKLPDSKAVNAALASYPMNFDLWDVLESRSPESMGREGIAILRRDRRLVESCMGGARCARFLGHDNVPVVNATVLQSEIGHELLGAFPGAPFSATYADRWIGGKYVRQYSLRSTDQGVDVSLIAASQGGGGHRNAAGFTSEIGGSL